MSAAGPRMRRPVVLAMTGISVVVVGAGFKVSEQNAPPRALGAASVVTARPLTGLPLTGLPLTGLPVTATPPTAPAPQVTTRRAPTLPTVTVNGAAYDTQYGPVQVQITVRSGRIRKAEATQYPQSNGRDQEINHYAVPALDREALAAQSAQIDTVSGATYTSDGYRSSLQSAIDAAHKAGAL